MAMGINLNGKAHSIEAEGETSLPNAYSNATSMGNGEGSQGLTVAAIANATASRLRDLPFTRERVKAALV